MAFKLDVPKRVFTPPGESAHQFQTPTGGRAKIGQDGTKQFCELPFQLPVYTVAEAEALAEETVAGCKIYVSDGNAGGPTLAISNGTNWMVSSTNIAIAIA